MHDADADTSYKSSTFEMTLPGCSASVQRNFLTPVSNRKQSSHTSPSYNSSTVAQIDSRFMSDASLLFSFYKLGMTFLPSKKSSTTSRIENKKK